MGGAVSSGRDNNELVDNLMSGNYIRSRSVEQVFRALDRADYMSPEARDQAYKDLAWRNGPMHLSAPCIYSEVMEALELKPGLSFLNVGSGTGYLSTLVGLIIGSSGISHGVEALPVVIEYANTKLSQFIDKSITLDEFDFCMPKYYTGNGLCLAPTHTYDRVYCGAGVLSKYESYFKQFTKVGGVLVMPLADTLVQLRRVSDSHWSKRNLLNVSFALLRTPDKDELEEQVKLDELSPPPLQVLSRGVIRNSMRAGLMRRHPELREPPAPPPPAPRTAPRRICIPYDAASDEDLNELHDLDEAGGAHEMNALLSLVLSMGQNRAAGSLRIDPVEDDELDGDYAEVGDLYTLDDRELRASGEPPLLPDDGVIVFDVAGGGMRARRWQPRPPSDKRTRTTEASTSSRTEAPPDEAEAVVEANESVTATLTETSAPSDAARSETSARSETPDETETRARTKSPRAPRLSRRAQPPRVPWTDSSSGDEEATQVKDSKRQKLDSGIGEGTASSGASPDKSPNKSDDKPSPLASRHTDDDDDTDMPWCDEDESSSSSVSTDTDEADDSDEGGGGGEHVAGGGGEGEGGQGTRSDLKRKNNNGDVDGGLPRKTGPKAMSEGRRRLQKRSRARGGAGAGGGGGGACGARSSGSDSGAESPAHAHRCPARRAPPAGRDARRVRLSLAMKRGVKELPLPHALKMYINYGRCYQF